jgi:hypothetical protein
MTIENIADRVKELELLLAKSRALLAYSERENKKNDAYWLKTRVKHFETLLEVNQAILDTFGGENVQS